MLKIKVSEATGHVLDGLVAIANGGVFHMRQYAGRDPGPMFRAIQWEYDWIELANYSPSTDWNEGGPLIERECMDILCLAGGDDGWQCDKYLHTERVTYYGPTPLIAAMRCFVASKLGDEIEIPEELA